jgi:hypothetical protein
MENPDAQSYFSEFPDTAMLNIYLLIPPFGSYSFTPLESNPLICRDPETGEVLQATRILASTIPCNQLEQETEMIISDECIEAIQECVNSSSCDRLIYYSECTEVPENFFTGNASGCHYEYEVLLTANCTPEETASTEVTQTEEEVIENFGAEIAQHEGQGGFEVTEVLIGYPAYIANLLVGQWILEINGLLLYDENFNNIYDADTVVEMIETSMSGNGSAVITCIDFNGLADPDDDVIFVTSIQAAVRF